MEVGLGLTESTAGTISEDDDCGRMVGDDIGEVVVEDRVAVTVIVSRVGLLCLALPVE